MLERAAVATVGIHSMVPASHPSAAVGLGTDRRGTGTLISSDGLILTINYVLMGAKNVIVTLTNGQQFAARVIAQDYPSGLGLLKIDARGLPFLETASSKDCALGQDVFTVASVGGEARRADSGVISYIGEFDALWEFVLERCLMTSAMSLGLGGGPLCNPKSEVIGVSYLGMADIGRSILAVPSEYFIDNSDELLKHGRRVSAPQRAWLGVLTYTLQEHVIIAGVMPGAPGDKAGLRQGDVVLAVDGRDISERRALYDALWSHRPGENVGFTILRDNQVRSMRIPGISVEDYFS